MTKAGRAFAISSNSFIEQVSLLNLLLSKDGCTIQKEWFIRRNREPWWQEFFYGIDRLTKELYDAFVEYVIVYSHDRIEVKFRFKVIDQSDN